MKKHITTAFFLLFTYSAVAEVPLSYTGRLVNSNGSPVTGPVNLKVELARTDGMNPPSVLCTQTISSVPLSNGVFHLKIDFTIAQCGGDPISKVLADTPANESAAIRVTDVTNSKMYSFQAIHAIPFSSVSYYAKSLAQMGAIAGQVLSWNGTQWAPASAGGTGSVTSVATGSGLTGGPITSSGTISVATGGITAAMLAQMGAVLGNTLKWNGSAWAPSADAGITSESDPTVQGWAKNTILACTSAQTLRFDALLNSGAGGLYCSNISLNSDSIAEGSTNLFFSDARAKTAAVANSISDAVTDVAPSQNAVFDALNLKQNTLTSSSNVTVGSLQSSPTLVGSSGVEYGSRITPTINQTSTAGYTGLLVNVTETATGSGAKKLLDLQVGGVSKYSIDANGSVISGTATQGTTANYTSAGGSQLVVGHDSTNKTTIDVDALGFTTFNAAGTAGGFNFSGGNVGIGSPSPQYPLDVNGTVGIGARLFMDRDGSNNSWIGVRGTDSEPLSMGHGMTSSSSGTVTAHQFLTMGSLRAAITSAGFFGIGTSTPELKLQVSAASTSQAIFGRPTAAGDSRIYVGGSTAPDESGWAWYNPTLNALALGISGDGFDQSLVLKRGGNVGIGIDAPTETLHVDGGIRAGVGIYTATPYGSGAFGINRNSQSGGVINALRKAYQIEANTGYSGDDSIALIEFGSTDFGTILSKANSQAHALYIGGVEKLRLDASGNLNVSGAGKFSPTTLADGYIEASAVGADPTLVSERWSGTSNIFYGVRNRVDNGGYHIENTGAAAIASQVWSPRLSITHSGNVGVGATNPAAKLQVVDGAIMPATGNAPTAGIMFPTDPGLGGGDSAWLRHFVTTGETTVLQLGIDNDADDILSFFQMGSERMRIHNGRVGIGVAIPSQALDVNGTVKATSFQGVVEQKSAIIPADNNWYKIASGMGEWCGFDYRVDSPTANMPSFSRGSIRVINDQSSLSISSVSSKFATNTNVQFARSGNSSEPGVAWVRNLGSTNATFTITDSKNCTLALDGTNVATPPSGTGQSIYAQLPGNATYTNLNSVTMGSVGIGSSSPFAKTDIAATGANAKTLDLINLQPDAVGNSADLRFFVNSWGETPASCGGSENCYRAKISAINTNASARLADLAFYTNEHTSLSERMRILGNGSVGIGTPTPQDFVEVRKDQNAFTRLLLTNSSTPTGLTQAGTSLRFMNGSNYVAGNFVDNFDSSYNIGTQTGSPLILQTAATERMRVGSTGNVGIGITSPTNKLDVQGRVRFGSTLDTTAPNSLAGVTDVLELVAPGASSPPAVAFHHRGKHSTYLSSFGTVGTTQGFRVNSSTGEPEAQLHVQGRVGVGTTDPQARLHVSDTETSTSKVMAILNNSPTSLAAGDLTQLQFRLYNDGQPTARMFTEVVSTSDLTSKLHFGTRYANGTNYTNTDMTLAGGKLGIGITNPSERLHVVGNVEASGTVRASGSVLTSDARLKKDFAPLSASLEKILQLNGYSYHWKDQKRFSPMKQIGLIAQEVQKVYPEAVTKGADGFFAVSYSHLIAPVIEAIKELAQNMTAETTKRDQEIADLKRENAMMKARLERLETAMEVKK